MADFGKAGVRTPHVSPAAGAVIKVSTGESLICTLDVKGKVPVFAFGCEHHDALVKPSGPPVSRYQWDKFDQPNSSTPNGDVHVLALGFIGAERYRFRMEVFDANMALLKTLLDVEYETSEPTDVADESITLFAR